MVIHNKDLPMLEQIIKLFHVLCIIAQFNTNFFLIPCFTRQPYTM
jgi:hypothetical protein